MPKAHRMNIGDEAMFRPSRASSVNEHAAASLSNICRGFIVSDSGACVGAGYVYGLVYALSGL